MTDPCVNVRSILNDRSIFVDCHCSHTRSQLLLPSSPPLHQHPSSPMSSSGSSMQTKSEAVPKSYSDYIMETMGEQYLCFIHPSALSKTKPRPAATSASAMAAIARNPDPYGGGSSSSGVVKKRVASDSEDEVTIEVVPEGKGKGKGRAKKAKVDCCICDDGGSVGVTCSDGHFSCKECVRQYVNLTLLPTKTVYYDFIPCPSECDKFLPWKSTKAVAAVKGVEDILLYKTKKVMEKKQMDVAYNVAGERDPDSEALLNKNTKPCPNCTVPIEKAGGCMHMCCSSCNHDFFWTCSCKYPFHSDSCEVEYPVAQAN